MRGRGAFGRSGRRRPRLSIVVIVYDMPQQAANTVVSLSPAHQQGVSAHDYEILVVENMSPNLLGEAAAHMLAPNVRYLLRDDASQSPAAAINHGARLARGDTIAVMVDGARMVTPGVVAMTLAAQRLGSSVVVSVPGYHLGDQLHQDAVRSGYGAAQEQRALTQLDWRADGYRLFDMAVPSASCSGGFLQPIGESNCIAVPRPLYRRLGGFDEGFRSLGGGYVNLDFYRRAVDEGMLVLLPGEGTFHQFHGGATTGAPGVDREALLAQMRAEYEAVRGEVHAPPMQTPVLFGRIGSSAMPFLGASVRKWTEAHSG